MWSSSSHCQWPLRYVLEIPQQRLLDHGLGYSTSKFKQVREAGQAINALCLADIVDKIIEVGGCVITYNGDGSRRQVVGSYCVQGITIVVKMLDISEPAFKFVTAERFKTSIKWEKDLLESVAMSTEKYRDKVISILSLVLPKLAKGFFMQRDVFGFGPFNTASSKLVTWYSLEALNQVPVNNLDAETAVGAINHELRLRGSCEIEAAGSHFVKSKLYGLIELKPVDAYEYRATAKSVKGLVKKQRALELEGLEKEAEGVSYEKRKFKDLHKLKEFGGPFTEPKEVQEFLERQDVPEKDKQERLYVKTWYARDPTLSLRDIQAKGST